MITRIKTEGRWAIILLVVAFQTCVSTARADDLWMPSMKEFASGFMHLEQSLEAGKNEAVAKQAVRLHKQADALAGKQNAIQPEQRDSFASHLDTISQLSKQLATRASSGESQYTAWYVAEIRSTCVSCHASFRDLSTLNGFYPARGNTVIADVTVTTADGQQKTDHSGSIVFLDGLIKPATRETPRPVISQRQRRFIPRVLPVVRGTTVDFPNDDTILHNVFSLSKTRRFDLDVYRPGKSKAVTFSKPGLVRIYCNIHPEMACSILVLNNPHFATTNSAGRCIISGIPNGTFTARTWQELGGEARARIRLQGNGSVVQVKLNVKEARRSLAHRNKYGQAYKKTGKYK